MTELEMNIAQMLMVSIGGAELTEAERDSFERYRFGGFILFSKNCGEAGQIQSLCSALYKTAGDMPPLIAVDQEGGRVHRLPEPFTRFPAAALIGKTGNPDLAYKSGRATAAELTMLGINLDFAPVLDVDSNAKNPIIGDRSFGPTPDKVSTMALAWAQGLRDGAVIPCGKHFPGHGDTDKDSHIDLPVVEKSLRELQALELLPFALACRNQIEAMMTAHVVYPALDRQWPATLSGRIINGLLRNGLGYQGVVFSDDMEMQAITGNFGSEEAALLAVRSGIDMLLYCHDLSKAVGVFEALCREARRDRDLRARIVESSGRIEELKRRCVKKTHNLPNANLLEELSRLNHRKLLDEIYGSL